MDHSWELKAAFVYMQCCFWPLEGAVDQSLFWPCFLRWRAWIHSSFSLGLWRIMVVVSLFPSLEKFVVLVSLEQLLLHVTGVLCRVPWSVHFCKETLIFMDLKQPSSLVSLASGLAGLMRYSLMKVKTKPAVQVPSTNKTKSAMRTLTNPRHILLQRKSQNSKHHSSLSASLSKT